MEAPHRFQLLRTALNCAQKRPSTERRVLQRGRTVHTQPGEPWCNGYIESFNSRVRDECLNMNVFWFVAQAAW